MMPNRSKRALQELSFYLDGNVPWHSHFARVLFRGINQLSLLLHKYNPVIKMIMKTAKYPMNETSVECRWKNCIAKLLGAWVKSVSHNVRVAITNAVMMKPKTNVASEAGTFVVP